MNLILNVNTELHSVKGSADGELKKQAAIEEAMENIRIQARTNQERIKKGLQPLPYNTTVQDEYGKNLVVIKETKSLEEIRMEYRKKQDAYSFQNKERNLFLAMNEIGNSDKDEFQFKEELNRQLNTSLFVTDADLSPAQERILDYFGDLNGLFSSINFKEDISVKCIKDLIDLPSPKTGKPPKDFEELLSNIMGISRIFRNNPGKENYIETARNYINIRYQKIVPKKYKCYFKERGGLFSLIRNMEKEDAMKEKINSLEFEISDRNFKKVFQTLCTTDRFRSKPVELANYLIRRVLQENKEAFSEWMKSIGCTDSAAILKTLVKWQNETERENNIRNNRDRETKGLRGE